MKHKTTLLLILIISTFLVLFSSHSSMMDTATTKTQTSYLYLDGNFNNDLSGHYPGNGSATNPFVIENHDLTTSQPQNIINIQK